MVEPSPAGEPVVVKVREHGPLLVTGPISVIDHTGRPFELDGTNVAFCRCGASLRKPFCDGAHRGIGFDGTCSRDVASGQPAPTPAPSES